MANKGHISHAVYKRPMEFRVAPSEVHPLYFLFTRSVLLVFFLFVITCFRLF
jgi:hypothetical protein